MSLSLRHQRLKLVWLLVIPFLYIARPTVQGLLVGGGMAVVGAVIRGWAAGVIIKDRALCVGGPYAYTRNPLYVGSFFIGLGVTVAGGVWIFVALFLLFYAWSYGRTMRAETELLGDLFGEDYRRYREEVPLLIPRLTPYRPGDPGAGEGPEGEGPPPGGFSFRRYLRNKEYEAALGLLAGFAFLTVKMLWA